MNIKIFNHRYQGYFSATKLHKRLVVYVVTSMLFNNTINGLLCTLRMRRFAHEFVEEMFDLRLKKYEFLCAYICTLFANNKRTSTTSGMLHIHGLML